MHAVRVHRFGGPENIVAQETAEPSPGNEQVVGRIHAAGVNPVDTYVRSVARELPRFEAHAAHNLVLQSGAAGKTVLLP